MTSSAEPNRGITLGVLRRADGHDCTLNGVTAQAQELTLVAITTPDGWRTHRTTTLPVPRDVQLWFAQPDKPAVTLVIRNLGGETIAHLEPVVWDREAGTWVSTGQTMAGGNYATTGDSRVSTHLENLLGHRFYGALPVHDRIER